MCDDIDYNRAILGIDQYELTESMMWNVDANFGES